MLRGILNYSTADISLNGHKSLTRGYENGNICSRYYDLNNLPSDVVIIDDLRNFIGLYKELKGLVGYNILQIDSLVLDAEYQESVQNSSPIELPDGPIPKPDPVISTMAANRWPRDSKMARKSIENSYFKCEIDEFHTTFVSENGQVPFMEAHHLIPMEFQSKYDSSIDVPENIVSLCPNCHRSIHHSIRSTRLEILKLLFEKRRQLLFSKRGLMLEFEKLISFYNI